MNLELHGKNECIAEVMCAVSCHESKFALIMTDVTKILLITFLIWKESSFSFSGREVSDRHLLLSRISEIDSLTSKY
jgi:hypothetical protein